MSRPFALLRAVSPRYAECLVRADPRPDIDPARAAAQHAAYAAALRAAGFDVEVLPAIDAPDGCFVEDCAVVLDDEVAVATRPGAPSRRGEVPTLIAALAPRRRIERIEAPATLDGGDVLRVGRTLFVGRSARTNAGGAAALGEIAGRRGLEVRALPVRDALHLESAVSALDDTAVLLDPHRVDPAWFEGLDVIETAEGEGDGANVLRLPSPRHVLAAAEFAGTRARLERAGRAVTAVELSEFTKGDAGPTCLSVAWRGSAGAE